MQSQVMTNIRNIAIIAHVDHGKTTLVDALLRQSHTVLNKEVRDQTCIMDSNDLEKERGITIFSKNASVIWKDTKINIIDTPGHADFGGEVERVLKMAEGALLLVDAQEGPMPQTRFVLKKALSLGLKIIVVINKIDKPNARVNYALNKTFDLFVDLGASDEIADFPIIYASSRLGKAGLEPTLDKMTTVDPLFDAILEYIPAPQADSGKPLQMLVSNFRADNYKGRIAIGRVYNGTLRKGQDIAHINRNGQITNFRLTSLRTFLGLEMIEVPEVPAGDIAAISGIPGVNIGETIADPQTPVALPLINIEEPTVKMTFTPNASPLAGREGQFCTSRQLRERIYRELDTDVALKIVDNQNSAWEISGRGELHLAILIERLRREGYELEVSRPQAVVKSINGVQMTPWEKVYVETPQEFSGLIIQKLGSRFANLTSMETQENITFQEFEIATKNLIGYRNQFLTDTKGQGIINTEFIEFRPDQSKSFTRGHGSLIAHESGNTTLYGLLSSQDRGELFLQPGIFVYEGQVVGKNSREDDMRVNVCKEKQLTNNRSKGEGVSSHFNAPREITLEVALDYIDASELVEITPQNIRIRKIHPQKR